MSQKRRSSIRVSELTRAALFVVLISVCSWISIPTAVPFTLQTFGVLCALGILGGRLGTLAVLAYLLLGAIGLPVFSGFMGGAGALFGPTGGYLVGFLAGALAYWPIERIWGDRKWGAALGMCSALLACYAFGTLWFMNVYARTSGKIALSAALGMCVLPFVLPDLAKLALALLARKRLQKRLNRY